MNSPWSHLSRSLTHEEWAALTAWRKTSQLHRIKQGTTREDGKLFWGYARRNNGGEVWRTREAYELSKTKIRELMRTYRLSQAWRDRANKRDRDKYANDPVYRARDKASYSAWRANNRDKDRRTAQRHALRKKNQIHPAIDWACEKSLYREAVRLTRSTGVEHQVDHIIPVASGGWHHHENLQILPKYINCQKNKNPFWRSIEYRDWTTVPRDLWPTQLAAKYQQLIAA